MCYTVCLEWRGSGLPSPCRRGGSGVPCLPWGGSGVPSPLLTVIMTEHAGSGWQLVILGQGIGVVLMSMHMVILGVTGHNYC